MSYTYAVYHHGHPYHRNVLVQRPQALKNYYYFFFWGKIYSCLVNLL